MKLFKRNAQGKPIFWEAEIKDNKIAISFGNINKPGTSTLLNSTRDINKEFESLIKAKLKNGYKELSSLYDNAPTVLTGDALYNYLDKYLPKYNTDNNGKAIVMLCKTLDDARPFKSGSYFDEFKINGERCHVVPEKQYGDLFKPIRFRYFSREGVEWTDKMSWYDDILLKELPNSFINRMITDHAGLDGEFYLPGYPINAINSFIKNTTLPQHYKLQYWVYDYVVEEMPAAIRYKLLTEQIGKNIIEFKTKEDHLNNDKQFVLLSASPVSSFSEAVEHRDKYIDLGFEGLVMRLGSAEYQFGGRRNNSMLKFKKIYDGYFTIKDIIPEGKRTNLPKFVLQNDINDALFEVTLNACHETQENILANKDNHIGKTMLVEYRERSGDKQVPFHAKGLCIR